MITHSNTTFCDHLSIEEAYIGICLEQESPLNKTMRFVPASSQAADFNDSHASSLRSLSAAGIAADVAATCVRSSGAVGIGFHPSSSVMGSNDERKRPRESDFASVSSPLVEHFTIRTFIFMHELDAATQAAGKSLEIMTSGFASAWWVPNKWGLLHAMVLPRLHLLNEQWIGRQCPSAWSDIVRQVSPQVLEKLVRDMCLVRNFVCNIIAFDAERVLASPPVALCNQNHHQALCVPVRRWCGEAEVDLARSIFRKRRADATIVPLRIGCIRGGAIVDAAFDAPALHIVSADAFYCRETSSMWNAVFPSPSAPPSPAGAASTIFISLPPKSDPASRDESKKEDGVAAELRSFVDAWTQPEPNIFLVRKELQNCEGLRCPMCAKTFRGAEAVTSHWHQRCLPQASMIAQSSTPLFV